MAEKVGVVPHDQSYDPDIAALAVDTNCGKLLNSMDPVSVAPKLVSRRLISSQQAQNILDDRVKTRSERNLAFLNLIKSSSDPTWFSSLLEAIGEEKTTERLKEVLEESYRALKSAGGHGLPHASQITLSSMPVSSQIRGPSTSQPGKHSQFHHVWHPLENEFERVKSTFLKVLEERQQPSLNDLKEYCCDRVASVETMQLCVAKELEYAPSYEAVVRILFKKLCKWLSFSLLDMILDYFQEHLGEVRTQVEVYKKQLKKALQEALVCTEEYLNQGESPPTAMQKIFVRCLLEAKGITPENVIAYRQFLSSSLEIPVHLLVLISVLYGSLLLELWIPKELTPQVVQRVKEVWRELWRRKVENIEVGDRSFDLLQQSNKEKATLIGASLSVSAYDAEQWKHILLSCGTRLYEEYGRHESLQSCVRKHKEAGHLSPEAIGALEWLLLHYTPEVAEREGKDPLNVLLTTVYLGCCDVVKFVGAVVRCLESDPAVGRRLQEAFEEFFYPSMLGFKLEQLTWLPDEVVTKVYLKYRHLPSLLDSISPGVKDPQHLSHKEAERVKSWFQGHMMRLEEGRASSLKNLPMSLVEAGVTDEELRPALDRMVEHQGTKEAMDYELMSVYVAEAHRLSKMEKSFPHSQEDVRAIQVSFQMYSASISISPDDLLQAANSQRRDVFQLFFEALERQKAVLEPLKSYLRGKLPPYYQQDLEQAFTPSAGAVAMETSTTPKEKPVSEPTLVSATGSSSRDSSHSSHLAEVKRQFQLQVAKVFPLFSSAPKMKALSEKLARTPLFLERDSSAMLMSAEDSSVIIDHLLQLWSWYEVSFLRLAARVLLDFRALEELNQFVRSRDDSLQYTSLPECFPQGPLTDDQLAPPPGYTPLRLTLSSAPEDVPMGHLWSLKKHLCSSLALQPYALLLKGYMEGSTHIIFHISQHVTLDEERVAAMFVGAKRAGLYPHSITTALGTAQEVEHRLMDMLPLIKRRRVRGQMEGLTVAEREHQSATDTAQQ